MTDYKVIRVHEETKSLFDRTHNKIKIDHDDNTLSQNDAVRILSEGYKNGKILSILEQMENDLNTVLINAEHKSRDAIKSAHQLEFIAKLRKRLKWDQ